MPAASASQRHVTPAGSAAGRSRALYSAPFVFRGLAESRRSAALDPSMGDDQVREPEHLNAGYSVATETNRTNMIKNACCRRRVALANSTGDDFTIAAVSGSGCR